MFNQFKVTKITSQSRGIFDTYIYRTEDSLADVSVSGYFNECRFTGTESWDNGVIQVLASDGLSNGVIVNGDFVIVSGGGSSPIIAPENWACDAKPSGAAVVVTTGNSWQSAIINSTIPNPEMINPNLVYQGNGRYLNTYGAPITVKGFVSVNIYTASIALTTYQFTVGLWDGANIVPDVAKLVTWSGIRGINQASGGSGQVYSYEIDVPAGGIFGFAGQRITATGSDNMLFYGYQHTVRAL